MPIFFFVSGHFSKVSVDSPVKAFKSIFIPYIIFCVFWIIFSYFVLGYNLPKLPFLVPVYGLWFLFSLFIMRLILPILVKIKYIIPITIMLSLVLGLVSIPEDFFSYHRTFCFLPVFLFGYYYNDYKKTFYDKVGKYKSIINLLKSKVFVFIMLILFIIIMWKFCSYVSFDLMQLRSSYVKSGLNNMEGIIARFIIIISGIMAALFINKLIMNKTTFLTKFGVNSLAVYVLHFYFARFISINLSNSPLKFIFTDPLLSGLYILFIVLLMTYFLSRDFITKIVNGLINTFAKVITNP